MVQAIRTRNVAYFSENERQVLSEYVALLRDALDTYPEETVDQAVRNGRWMALEEWLGAAIRSTFGIFAVLAGCEERCDEIDEAQERAREAYSCVLTLVALVGIEPGIEDFHAAKAAMTVCRDTCRRLLWLQFPNRIF